MTEEQIKSTIKELDSFDRDTLVYYYKCATSRKSAAEKSLLKPLISAIEKKLKATAKLPKEDIKFDMEPTNDETTNSDNTDS